MQRKLLEDLGLDKETVDNIIAENDKGINAEKEKTKTAQESLSTL